MKQDVYVYGSHVKQGYRISISSFSELDVHGLPKKKQGIYGLVDSMCKAISRRKFIKYDGSILDDVHMKRPLDVFAEYRLGPVSKDILGFDRVNRLLLMNDEVVWQWKTGSVLCYRFLCNAKIAEEFYKFCLAGKTDTGKVEISRAETAFKYRVGDVVEFLEDFDVLPNQVSMFANFTGYFGYKKGEKVRIYSINNSDFIASGEDGKTLLRIPGTGGAKEWIGFGWIPLNKVKLVQNMNLQ